MITGRDGFVSPASHQGLWIWQARALSRYVWMINRKQPLLSAFSLVTENSSTAYYIASPRNWKRTGAKEANPAQQSIELQISRTVGYGMDEELCLTNHTQIATSVELSLKLGSDFISPTDDPTKGTPVGKVRRRWQRKDNRYELILDYKASHRFRHQKDNGVAVLHRGVRLEFKAPGHVRPKYERAELKFKLKLRPHESWRLILHWIAQIDGHDVLFSHQTNYSNASLDRKRESFLQTSTQLSSPAAPTFPVLVLNTLERSKRDLASLRIFDLDSDDEAGETWIPAGGNPNYLGLFGRDSLASSWQAALLSTAMMRGTLAELPKTQGAKIDDWRDEQPGKFVHELHTDPRAQLNFNPHGRYYGGVTASIYYPIVLAAVWHWTGKKSLVQRYIRPALDGLAWADKYLLDGSRFYRYRTHSTQGEKNQSWKDSNDAIVYPDGSQVKDPLGTCEMQAFVYASKLHLSELLWWMGDIASAKRLFHEAKELKKRFNDFFWMETDGYLGMAIDHGGRLVRSIASDPGHCLASGIVERGMARRVADRMVCQDLFSGWGVRTLSAKHPAFNPFSYHRGSVWPVENAVFVLAFARYGLRDKMHMLARAIFETASIFKYYRLPEVFAGHSRDAAHRFPGMYPKANWPQAWSASAPFTAMQALLGIYPYAPMNVLLLEPWLPEWLPEFTIESLRIGEASVSMRFHREENGVTNFQVTELKGKLHIVRHPCPLSLINGFGERVSDVIRSLLPSGVRLRHR
jgi:glycogen debranching enzyme